MSDQSEHSGTQSVPDVLPEAICRLPLTELHMETSAYDALARAGITTIGNLFDRCSSRSKASQESVVTESAKEYLNALLASLNPNGEVDWIGYWNSCGIKLLPAGYDSAVSLDRV